MKTEKRGEMDSARRKEEGKKIRQPSPGAVAVSEGLLSLSLSITRDLISRCLHNDVTLLDEA